VTTLENDDNYMETLNACGNGNSTSNNSKEELQAILGGVVFDEDDNVVSAQAFYLSYFLQDRSTVAEGSEEDPINEACKTSFWLYYTLSRQFVLTVFLGVIHGLVLLPVLLSLVGPAPFASAEDPHFKEPATLEKTGGGDVPDADPQKEGK
jgi:hypothetical protein